MHTNDPGLVDGPRAIVAIVAALLMVVSTGMLPSVAAIHNPHSDPHGSCDLREKSAEVLVANPDHGNATVMELLWVAARDHSTWQQIRGTWVDAYIRDLGCHSATLTYDVTLRDGPLSTTTLQLRFYDHFAEGLGETDCFSGSSNTGSVPDGTQYVAAIPCEGIPNRLGSNNVHTVEVELDLNS